MQMHRLKRPSLVSVMLVVAVPITTARRRNLQQHGSSARTRLAVSASAAGLFGLHADANRQDDYIGYWRQKNRAGVASWRLSLDSGLTSRSGSAFHPRKSASDCAAIV